MHRIIKIGVWVRWRAFQANNVITYMLSVSSTRHRKSTYLVVHGLEVFLEIVDRIGGADDNLADRIPADKSGKTAQGLFA